MILCKTTKNSFTEYMIDLTDSIKIVCELFSYTVQITKSCTKCERKKAQKNNANC